MPCGLGGNKTTKRKLVLFTSCTCLETHTGAVWHERHELSESVRRNGADRWLTKYDRGDGACGKTSLLNVFTRGPVPDIFVDSVHIELSLWDTAGQEEFDRLRSLSYDDTHAIMLCFSVDSKDSLENVESKWTAEIADNCQGVKIVLVALKCDLREQDNEDEDSAETTNGAQQEKKPTISYNQGLEVARRIGALRYLECSAMRNRGVNEAFTEAARVALSVKLAGEKGNSKCSVM
ncbi:GTP-binding protein RHO3 [Lachnellula hyalina]|uniref:GTP-binding protein RHO3 n=1 Tax=Lachnellula hyalina TaxID=1316788 RepID=A0A8H8R8F7_9HELO|nr:GTP-binding protein RHO3 [Lachnellula hyalina]TVY30350.1 GTP-binding protein RHO3 [Lachnellula hyalina]